MGLNTFWCHCGLWNNVHKLAHTTVPPHPSLFQSEGSLLLSWKNSAWYINLWKIKSGMACTLEGFLKEHLCYLSKTCPPFIVSAEQCSLPLCLSACFESTLSAPNERPCVFFCQSSGMIPWALRDICWSLLRQLLIKRSLKDHSDNKALPLTFLSFWLPPSSPAFSLSCHSIKNKKE